MKKENNLVTIFFKCFLFPYDFEFIIQSIIKITKTVQ